MFSKYWYLSGVTIFDFIFDKKIREQNDFSVYKSDCSHPTYAGRIGLGSCIVNLGSENILGAAAAAAALVVVQDFKRYLTISKSGPGVGTLSGGPGRRHLARLWKTRRVVEQNMSRALVLAGSLVLFSSHSVASATPLGAHGRSTRGGSIHSFPSFFFFWKFIGSICLKAMVVWFAV